MDFIAHTQSSFTVIFFGDFAQAPGL